MKPRRLLRQAIYNSKALNKVEQISDLPVRRATDLQEVCNALAMGQLEANLLKEFKHMLLRTVIDNLSCRLHQTLGTACNL